MKHPSPLMGEGGEGVKPFEAKHTMTTTHENYFTAPLDEIDPDMAGIAARELDRQRDSVNLIASENYVSRAVLEIQSSAINNKTVEGYPGARYHGGAEVVDEMERLGIARACELFGMAHANLQPHSGSQANQTVLHAFLKPGDRIVSMDLNAGGHLSHGSPVNQTGRIFDVAHYGVRRQDGRVDMDEVADVAKKHKPQMLIAGGSAYPRTLDFAAFREIAESVGAKLLTDIAHIAGLVAGGAHPTPAPHADWVTMTTTKTLRGARGGIILCHDPNDAKKIDSALFPGVQGSAHLQTMAAKAVCFAEALRPEFRAYAAAVVENARAMADALMDRGYDVISGGTDTHLMLVDLRRQGLKGNAASARLEAAGITGNKNQVPFDEEKPWITSGIRVASSAGTTRGFTKDDFTMIGGWIADVLDALAAGEPEDGPAVAATRDGVAELCAKYPLYDGM